MTMRRLYNLCWCVSFIDYMFNTSYTVSITNSIVGYVSSLLGGLFSVIYVSYSVDSTLYYNRQSYSTCNVWLVGWRTVLYSTYVSMHTYSELIFNCSLLYYFSDVLYFTYTGNTNYLYLHVICMHLDWSTFIMTIWLFVLLGISFNTYSYISLLVNLNVLDSYIFILFKYLIHHTFLYLLLGSLQSVELVTILIDNYGYELYLQKRFLQLSTCLNEYY
jgi:hypothetical protein